MTNHEKKIRKDHILGVRISDQDQRALAELARVLGVSQSEAARQAIRFSLYYAKKERMT